ncbi:DNA-binding protein [Cellvibrio sp. OA-2007]|uniref:DNA-binding protein n=1 Tax=Cellvibrio sp. OA-2007 TaxID=529823 RepID=UPI000785FD1C|nr:DNA-binding protein [Cellvibrio sp. OA-2007]
MANSGINKHQVKKARDALVAKGQNPSIDAVRIELGNTGSKATIHRYLRELAEENPLHPGNKPAISETLGSLVEQLAAQLHQEAQELIAERETSLQATTDALKAQLESQQQTLASTANENQQLKARLADYEQLHKTSTADVEAQKILLGRLEQQLTDKGVLIAEKDNHIRSLEEKHQHAREALEHYRQSVKDQRDQDQRRHEHQVQQLQAELRQLNQTLSIKQTDLTQLNTANAELTVEVRQLRKASNDAGQQLKVAESKLLAVNEQYQTTTHQVVELTVVRDQLFSDKNDLSERLGLMEKSFKAIEIELVTVKTELAVKNQLLESLGNQFTLANQNT